MANLLLPITPSLPPISVSNSMDNNVKIQRVMKDMTQEGLAGSVGVTRQTINAIEKGKYNPSLDLAFKLAKLFNMNIEELFFYGGDENNGQTD